MNRSNFNQTGGYPLNTERLQEMQTAYEIFNSFGSLAGDLTIISGCATIGTTVQDGFIYINGELLAFKSAAVNPNSTVIIIDTAVEKGFKNGVVKTVHTLRYATFGTAETSWLWSEFKRPIATKTLEAIHTGITERLTIIETKLATIATGAEVNVQSDWNVNDTNSDAYVKNRLTITQSFLYRGTYYIGDPGTDGEYTVTVPNLGTTLYYVLGALRVTSGAGNDSNDVFWTYAPINATSFKLYTREVASLKQYLTFDFVIISR